MCHVSSPHEVLGSLHFKRRVRMEEKLIRKWCFFLNPSSAEAPFLLKKKICVSFTLPLQSLETPLQTMWQHQLNSQLSWGRDTPAWENIVTQHRLQAWVCVCVCEYVHVSVCVCVCAGERDRESADEVKKTESDNSLFRMFRALFWQLPWTWTSLPKQDNEINKKSDLIRYQDVSRAPPPAAKGVIHWLPFRDFLPKELLFWCFLTIQNQRGSAYKYPRNSTLGAVDVSTKLAPNSLSV